MADEPNPTPVAPTPAPAPEVSGISGMLAKFDLGVAEIDAKKPVASDETKTTPDAPKTEPKPEEAKPEPKPDEPVPDSTPIVEPVWDKAPKNLRNAHFKFKRETEEKIAKAEAKVKELEGKSVQSPDDLKKIKASEERIAALEKSLEEKDSRLMQADYSKSDEFKRLYIDKGERAYKKAVADVKTLRVKVTDQTTQEEVERPATEADFNALRKLDAYEQDKKLDEMFGASAKRVAMHINNLDSIESEANEAISGAREKSAEQQKQAQKQREERNGEFEAASKRANAELLEKHAAYFAPDETNPEASKALASGYEYVDEVAKNNGKASVKEHAESTAIVRALAAAAPRLMVEKKQLAAKIKGLEEELAKYRSSSPGNAGSKASGAPLDDKPIGLKGMAAAFDKAK